jgi:diguanylate cyclase (GGDEF)-like protein/PAS domain S-box-containing protein
MKQMDRMTLTNLHNIELPVNNNSFSTETARQIILDSLPFDVWMKDLNGRYIAVNQSFLNYTGLTEENIIGKTDFDLYPETEAKIYVASDAAVFDGSTQGFFESVIGEDWKEEYKHLVLDKSGTPIGTAGYSRYITDRKKMEEDLKESERSQGALISNLPGVAFRCVNDKDWTMSFLSDGCFELTGYQSEELNGEKGITYNDLISPRFRENNYSKWEQDALENRKSNDEYTIITKSGEEKWVWEQSVPVQDKDGNFTKREGLIIDINQTKQILKELDESEDRFRTIFEKAPIGIGIFHTDTGFVEQLNPMFEEIVGRTAQELRMLDWRSYSHPAEIQTNLDKLKKLKEKEINGFTMRKRYIKSDGTVVWVNMMIVPFKAETISDMHLCMIQDITDSKQKEDEIIYLSYHDTLTGLYNRTFFEEEKKRFDVRRKLPMSVIMGDVNGLKMINDTFGHDVGDILLREIATILVDTCRAEDIIARIGGDEFVILLEDMDEIAAKKLCDRIDKACKDYVNRSDRKVFYASISLGYATKNSLEKNVDLLLKDAEKMLYINKNAERQHTRDTIIRAAAKGQSPIK